MAGRQTLLLVGYPPRLFFPGRGRYFNFFLETGQHRADRYFKPKPISLMKIMSQIYRQFLNFQILFNKFFN